jgi:hypothetical protein
MIQPDSDSYECRYCAIVAASDQFEFEGLDLPMEISVVSIRGGLLEDVKDVFPDLSNVESLLCCLTLQFDGVESMDLPSLDVSLNKFLLWEKAMINALGSDTWCNSVDPKTCVALIFLDASCVRT